MMKIIKKQKTNTKLIFAVMTLNDLGLFFTKNNEYEDDYFAKKQLSFSSLLEEIMKTIIIGVIGADVHAVGNKIMDYVLTNAGYNVVNIGVLSSQEDFINAAIETDAKAILVSSLYGHGEMDVK